MKESDLPEGWITVDGKVYIPEEEGAHLAANQCLHGLRGDDWGHSYCPEIKRLQQQIPDMRAEMHVAIKLLRSILQMDTFENEDGDLFYTGNPANMKASETHVRAWDFVSNPFDKDDYQDLL